MVERLIEVVIPADRADSVRRFLESCETIATWELPAQGVHTFRALVEKAEVEGILDPLQMTYGKATGFRLVVLPVEVSLPEAPEEATADSDLVAEPKKRGPDRISRDELSRALSGSTRLTPVFLVTVVLSTIVAAIGLHKESPAILVGAMVVAPLLGPNMALAFATTVGDGKLAWQALRTTAAGVTLALVVAFGFGAAFEVDTNIEILSRTRLDLFDLALALAAGAAGALAFTSKVSTSLVGVMVAVALLPPTVVVGERLASGFSRQSYGALLLLLGNVVCVLLAAITTFLLQGLGPREWWRAKESRVRAILVAAMLAVLLTVLAIVAQR